MLYYVIVVLSALLVIIIMHQISFHNKFEQNKTKIKESFNNIDILFEKKCNLLERAINIIKENNNKYKENMIIDNITKIKNNKLDRFQINHELTLAERDYKAILDLDKKISNIQAIKDINEELINIDNDLNGSIKYYNFNISVYNNLVKCFPSCVIAKIKGYKVKEFFKEEKLETLDILKEKN